VMDASPRKEADGGSDVQSHGLAVSAWSYLGITAAGPVDN
jgi:hypothetical protein